MHLISITSLISLSFSRLSFASPHLIHPILRSPAPFDPVVPCLPPLFFQLRYFSTFVPGDENLLPRLSVISFIFADLGTGITTLCSHTLQNDEVRNGILLADPWHFLPCGDSRVAFLWDGARLQVLEDRGCGLPFVLYFLSSLLLRAC
jgi:hypothetical protein